MRMIAPGLMLYSSAVAVTVCCDCDTSHHITSQPEKQQHVGGISTIDVLLSERLCSASVCTLVTPSSSQSPAVHHRHLSPLAVWQYYTTFHTNNHNHLLRLTNHHLALGVLCPPAQYRPRVRVAGPSDSGHQ